MPYKDRNSPESRASAHRHAVKVYARNKESVKKALKQYRGKNKAHCAAYMVYRRSTLLSPSLVVWQNVHTRCRKTGMEFTLAKEDVVVPELCPVFGFPLVVNTGHVKFNSPSLDRIDPSKGYIPGNVMVISHKANSIKQKATIEEVQAVLDYMKRVGAPARGTFDSPVPVLQSSLISNVRRNTRFARRNDCTQLGPLDAKPPLPAIGL